MDVEKLMAYSQKAMERMECAVPEKAIKAVRVAYRRSLNAGHSVLVVEDGKLYRVNPDMSRSLIREVARRVPIAKGTRYRMK